MFILLDIRYACMQEQLVTSYREQFNSSDMSFIAIQLPGYGPPDADGISPERGGNPDIAFYMRLAQANGAMGIPNGAVVATYDDSCAANQTNGCPHGNVHNVHKQPVGIRCAAQALNMRGLLPPGTVTQGPVATGFDVVVSTSPASTRTPRTTNAATTTYSVKVAMTGGTGPLYFNGTRNCTIPFILVKTGLPATLPCCQKSTSDFDVSADNMTWYDGYEAQDTSTTVQRRGELSVTFKVDAPVKPTMVRYTANKVFPQCAVYAQEGLPALPFQLVAHA